MTFVKRSNYQHILFEKYFNNGCILIRKNSRKC